MADEKTLEGVKKALEKSPGRNFEESLELAINLREVDLSQPQNRIDEEIVLPSGRGKEIKVGVFGSGELALQARKVADTVIEPDEIEDISEEKKDARNLAEEHQFFLAEPPLMSAIGRELGSILGPQGKMPNPITPDEDIEEVVKSLKGTVHVRSQDRRTFHAPVGTEKLDAEEIADNIDTVIRRIVQNLDRRERNLESVYVKTTMGPAVRIM
ncbi:MAG: 50S ribosomal protein L1 [Candidatus Thermoplasmatota archaeon]|nr:50S ribosomal protein L1 [Candidatus Thermoplasmatota archaeon]